MDKKLNMEKLIAFCRSRGFIYSGSEIYGGLANTWDYGPLGVEIKNNIKNAWWKFFVHEDKNSVGMDGGILMNPNVWVASGHVAGFSDPLMDCKACKTRHRADNLISNSKKGRDIDPDTFSVEELENFIQEKKIGCPNCGKIDWTQIRQFNLMFKTSRSAVADTENTVYLRPETAQSQFVNFQNLQRTSRMKIPFGVGQIGKAFRNEITPGNFIFRTVEFEQMEYQLFCSDADSLNFYEIYKKKAMEFYTQRLGIRKENLRFKDHVNLVHYAKAAVDAEYAYPTKDELVVRPQTTVSKNKASSSGAGVTLAPWWGEIGGTHHRGTYDLGNHQNHSNKSMEYQDPVTGEKFVPTVIESSHGADRVLLAVIADAYHEEEIDGETRIVLKIKYDMAPYKLAVLPLQKKELGEKAEEVFNIVAKKFATTYDETGSIGKRYRRQDEIGTPFCVTVDFQTLEDGKVTIRNRDTMQQERVEIDNITSWIAGKLE